MIAGSLPAAIWRDRISVIPESGKEKPRSHSCANSSSGVHGVARRIIAAQLPERNFSQPLISTIRGFFMLKIIESQEITMGTREIAAMLGKRHDNIKVSAERLAAAGVIGGGAALQETPYIDPQNRQTYYEYRLNKRDSLILVAQNCPEFTAAIVDRWQELEARQAPAIPKTYAEALLEAGRLAMEVERQAEQLALAAPKVEFVDKYVTASGNIGFRQMAKLLKAKEPELRGFLISNRIMYRLSGSLTPYQNHIDAGRFEVKAGVADHDVLV